MLACLHGSDWISAKHLMYGQLNYLIYSRWKRKDFRWSKKEENSVKKKQFFGRIEIENRQWWTSKGNQTKFNVTMTYFYILYFGQAAWQEVKQCQTTKKKEKHVKNCFLLNANLNETSFFFFYFDFVQLSLLAPTRREKFHFMIEFARFFLSIQRREKKNLLNALSYFSSLNAELEKNYTSRDSVSNAEKLLWD